MRADFDRNACGDANLGRDLAFDQYFLVLQFANRATIARSQKLRRLMLAHRYTLHIVDRLLYRLDAGLRDAFVRWAAPAMVATMAVASTFGLPSYRDAEKEHGANSQSVSHAISS